MNVEKTWLTVGTGVALILSVLATQEAGEAFAQAGSVSAAVRGQRLYAARCASCHGGNLQGASAPALRGARFFSHGRRNPPTAADFSNWTRINMPPAAPGSLSSTDSLAITEHIVRANGVYRDPQPLTPQRAAALRLR